MSKISLKNYLPSSVALLCGFLLSCAGSPITVEPINPPAGVQVAPNVQAAPNVGVVAQPATTAVVTQAPATPVVAPPQISAAAAIIYDPRRGRIVYNKNAHQRRAVASTQKLMTALLAVESGINQTVTVPAAATTVVPSKLYLKSGSRYKMGALVEAMLLKSGNDVAYTIGHGIAGSKAAFAQRMNARAKSLGMYNSNFLNPHGLTETGQYSTAYDIALLGATAYRSRFIRSCTQKKQSTFTYADGRTKELYNTNKLLSKVSFCDGMKTGTTSASGKCLVSSGTHNGQTRIVVVLGATTSDNLYRDSETLLRWGMTN